MEQLQKYEMQSSVLSEQESKESQKHNAIEKEIIGCISKIARPFTANQLLSELKEYSKNDLELGLDRLVKKNEVLLKTQNKIKIYYYNFKSEVYQEKMKDCEENEFRIQKYSKKINERKQEIKELEESLTKGHAARPLKDIEDEVQVLRDGVKQLKKEIAEKKAKASAPVEHKETNQLKRKYDNYLDEFQKRKRMCLRVVDIAADNFAKPKKTLMNDMEIETDEQLNFSVNSFKL